MTAALVGGHEDVPIQGRLAGADAAAVVVEGVEGVEGVDVGFGVRVR